VTDHDWKLQTCCALTGLGLQEGFDWLADKLSEKQALKKQKGQSVTKLEQHENQANLTNLTIRSSQFMMTGRSADKQAAEESKFEDNESSHQLEVSIKKKQRF
jgi:hypothetical protein